MPRDFDLTTDRDKVYFTPTTPTGQRYLRAIVMRTKIDQIIADLVSDVEEVAGSTVDGRDDLLVDPWKDFYPALGLPIRPWLRYDTVAGELWMPIEDYRTFGLEDPPPARTGVSP